MDVDNIRERRLRTLKRINYAEQMRSSSSGFRAGSNPKWVYPKGSSKDVSVKNIASRKDIFYSRVNYKRKNFAAGTTDRMLAYARQHDNKKTYAASIVAARNDPSLRDLKINRNHILADSSISSVLHETLHSVVTRGFDQQTQGPALHNFFSSLAGDDREKRDSAHQSFLESMTRENARAGSGIGHLHQAIHTISGSMGNLRFGRGPENVDIGGHFDPNEYEDRRVITDRSKAIRNATQRLGGVGLISQELVAASLIRPLDDNRALARSSTVPGSHPEQARNDYRRTMLLNKVLSRQKKATYPKVTGGITKSKNRFKVRAGKLTRVSAAGYKARLRSYSVQQIIGKSKDR